MSFISVPTFATGDSFSAAQANTYWRDNMAALWPYTTNGDMAYMTGSGVISRLGIGTAYQLLRSTGTAPSWDSLVNLLANAAMVSSQAAEDLIIGSSGTAIKRLPKGSNYDMLRMSGAGVVEWGTLATLLQAAAMISGQAAEDLIIGSSGTSIKRLAKGSNYDMLRMGGGGLIEWGTLATLLQAAAMISGQAAGDIVYPNGATSVARLAAPAAAGVLGHNASAPMHVTPTAPNQVLVANGSSTPTFANIGHITQVGRSSGLSYSRSPSTAIAWNSETIDDDELHSNTTNPSRITIAADGWYRVTAFLSFIVANSDWALFCYLNKNGTEFGGAAGWGGSGGGQTRIHGATGVVYATAGQYIEVCLDWNGTGGTTTIDTLSKLTVERLR